MIKMTHNLNDVVDYVESLKNEIISLNVQALENAKNELFSELPSMYGNTLSYLNIDIRPNSSDSIEVVIDGVDFDDVYEKYNQTEDDILEFVQNFIFNKIEQQFKEAGFQWQ